MSGSARWLLIVALHILWLFTLPNPSGRATALLGVVIAAACAAAPRLRLSPSKIAVLSFLLPALSWWATPRVVYLVLDGRAWLMLAWLILLVHLALSVGSHGARDDRVPAADGVPDPGGPTGAPPRPRTPEGVVAGLFVFWSFLLWVSVVSTLGVGNFIVSVHRENPGGCQSDPLADTFAIWESTPASTHLFIGWRTRDRFDERKAYGNHVHPYLIAMYGWVAAMRWAAGVDLYTASNTTVLLYQCTLIAAFITLLARLGFLRQRAGPVRLLLLFFATGSLVTMWRFWHDLFAFTSDNPYPLLAAVLIFVYAFLLAPARPVAATVSAAIFVALSPIHLPMLLLAVACVFGRTAGNIRDIVVRNRPLVVLSATASIVAIVSYTVPWLLIAMKGYQATGSTFLFRSGLDGDTRYFTGLAQAMFVPCPSGCCWARSASDLVVPAFVPLALFAVLGRHDPRTSPSSLARQLLFLTTPYFVSLIVFPQAISIHPYMYDHMLLIPVVITGAVAALSSSVEAGMTGTRLLATLLFLGGVISANLLGIVQGLARVSPP